MKYFAAIAFCIFAVTAHAEDLLVPISKFDNDSQQLSKDRVLEFWGYHNYLGDDQYQNTLKLRYYNPLEAGDWRGRLRIDTSYVANYTSNSNVSNSGQYSAGNTMLTVWGQDRTFLKPLGALVGGRIVFPFGNNGQWAAGPQLSWTFSPQVDSLLHVTDFSPLIRYMYSFGDKNPTWSQPPPQRALQLFPTLGFQITPSTMLRLWDENGAVYNSAGGGWFVPIDAMITHRLTKNWVVAIGASKQVVQTYSQYDWSAYGKISFNF